MQKMSRGPQTFLQGEFGVEKGAVGLELGASVQNNKTILSADCQR